MIADARIEASAETSTEAPTETSTIASPMVRETGIDGASVADRPHATNQLDLIDDRWLLGTLSIDPSDPCAAEAIRLTRSSARGRASAWRHLAGGAGSPGVDGADAGGVPTDPRDRALLHADADALRSVARHAAAIRFAPVLARTVRGRDVAALTECLGRTAHAYGLLCGLKSVERDALADEGATATGTAWAERPWAEQAEAVAAEPDECLLAWIDALPEASARLVMLRFGPQDPIHRPADGNVDDATKAKRVDLMRDLAADVLSPPVESSDAIAS